ncbi:flagellar protein FlgN [Clostridium sp. D2Q-11]|uniref:Flagellar protein FlgN n=1 Tax=Anaeromonas frigoriresistens TaxID=2683708 RepID=A0A942Z8M1_9FIRM|nr:flagellar protein FlgN [Anaeromonas frigoriresistens]MBS4538149.1 flagellar protein FlgN [Anaeromonas frigoriresistens]
MENLVEILNKVLSEEIIVYKELLEVIEKKTDILVKGDIKELDKITSEEHNIINKLGKFENLREKVIFNIGHRRGIKETLDVTSLLEIVNEDEREEISRLKDDIVEVLSNIKDRNDLNSSLIKDSLDYISLNLNLLTQNDTELTYGSDKKKSQSPKSLFNKKA